MILHIDLSQRVALSGSGEDEQDERDGREDDQSPRLGLVKLERGGQVGLEEVEQRLGQEATKESHKISDLALATSSSSVGHVLSVQVVVERIELRCCVLTLRSREEVDGGRGRQTELSSPA